MSFAKDAIEVFTFNGSGVYLIHCRANGKVYVGSSATCRRRVKGHFALLERGEHPNPHLQFAWNQYGEGAFECRLLEAHSEDGLLDCERYWITVYDALDQEQGFNFADPVESVGRTRRYVVYTPDGARQEIENLHKFCRDHGLCSANLTLVAQGKSSHHKGWLCRYADESESDWLARRDERNVVMSRSKSYKGDYLAIDPNGVRRRVVRLAVFCREEGLPYAGVHKSITDGWYVKGWRFERVTSVEQGAEVRP